jgi:acyl-CoA synthetase (AMP-forming)/AMP-acid ligase II
MKEASYIHFLYQRLEKFSDNTAIVYFTPNSDSEMPTPKTWTYHELLAQAKNLSKNISQYLEKKVGRVSKPIIAVASENYPDYILALLAIWGMDGIYMPLDPHPEKREALKNRLKLAGATALIGSKDQFQSDFFDGLPNFVFLELETLAAFIENKDILTEKETITGNYSLRKPAYIYCSSGTQGAPKMIENTFEGLPGRVKGTASLLNIQAGSGILGYCAPEFDASLLDILMALTNGACLYPATPKVRIEVTLIEKIFAAANEMKIPVTTMVVLPKILKELKNSPSYPKVFQSLKTMITMGEVCGIKVLANWFENIPGLNIMNGYGPTETTIAATVTMLNPQDFIDWKENKYSASKNLLPMGNPLPGVKLYFLDQENPDLPRIMNEEEIKTLKTGKEVQLIIGGKGVGRYLKPAGDGSDEALKFYSQLNSQHFLHRDEKDHWMYHESSHVMDEEKIRTIFSKNIPLKQSQSYYLTGDKICITPDPSRPNLPDVRFLGRIDRAVKKNGIFTALGQVENTIMNIWGDIIEIVKVVSMNENNFAAFIVPCSEKMKEFKNDENFEKEFFKEDYQKIMAKQDSRGLPAFYFLLPYSEEKISKVKSTLKIDELLAEATRWMIPGNDAHGLDEMEEKIAKIWRSYFYKEMESIPEFKKLMDRSTRTSLFNRQSHFIYSGGDSSSLMSMIKKVWKSVKKDPNPPASFTNEIVMDPRLGVIADTIKIHGRMKLHFNELTEYPLIFLTHSNNDLEVKSTCRRGYCKVEIKEEYSKELVQQVIKIVEEKIRSHFPSGPYLLIAEPPYKAFMNELVEILRGSDFAYEAVIDEKQSVNKFEAVIEELTQELRENSCRLKIEKWNSRDPQDEKLINNYEGGFPKKYPKIFGISQQHILEKQFF